MADMGGFFEINGYIPAEPELKFPPPWKPTAIKTYPGM